MPKYEKGQLGDMPAEHFREYGHKLVDWISDYLLNVENNPPLAQIKPGDVKKQLPLEPPQNPEEMDDVYADVDKIIMPGMTHWNHPTFNAYFNSTASAPGILAELLSGAFNINGMLWKSCPAATELEEVTMGWLRQMLGLPEDFFGVIFDGGSSSTMHAIRAALCHTGFDTKEKGFSGRDDVPRFRLYCSEDAHSSIDKGALTVGLGLENIRKIPMDNEMRMIPQELARAIEEDKANGWHPFCVVATVGTTSTTAIDPVPTIAGICEEHNLWLHVDAAHGGIAAIVPAYRSILDGVERADSMVVNPHKWMFVPIDCSAFYTRNPEAVKNAFSLVPEYLKTKEENEVINYMDYGIQLGRRFRSLKLWFVIRYFGVQGIINNLTEHMRLGEMFADRVDADPNFERLAPKPLSTTCFRYVHDKLKTEDEINAFNQRLMDEVNATGKIFLSHTKIRGKFAIRYVVSSLRTEARHVREAWDVLKSKVEELIKQELEKE